MENPTWEQPSGSRAQTSSHTPNDDLELDWNITAPTKPEKKQTPGPGSYNGHYYGSIGYGSKSGSGKRILGRHFVPHKPPAGPGPAAYNPRLAKNGPSFSLGGRLAQLGSAVEEAYPSPGPGEYNISGDIGNRPAPSIKWRTTLFGDKLLPPPSVQTANVLQPGPCTYENQGKPFGATATAASIKLPLPKPPKQGPAPGAYTPRMYDKKAIPAYSLSPRLIANPLGTYIDNTLPGPGAYHVRSACFDDGEQSTSAVAPGRIFGERLDVSPDNGIPGCGDYSPERSTQVVRKPHGMSMKPNCRDTVLAPIQDRLDQIKANRPPPTPPGPGHYDIVEAFGKDARKVTLKSRIPPPKKLDTPGPGKHDMQASITSAHKHVGGPSIRKPLSEKNYVGYTPTSQDDTSNAVPGPGHYSPRNELTDRVQKSMGVSIKDRLKPREDYNAVGPGQYTLIEPNNAKITIKGKPKHFALEAMASTLSYPGPGSYHPEDYLSIQSRTSPRKSA